MCTTYTYLQKTHCLTKEELKALDMVLTAYSDKEVMNIRRLIQQSDEGVLTLEEVKTSLKRGGLTMLARELKENIDKGMQINHRSTKFLLHEILV